MDRCPTVEIKYEFSFSIFWLMVFRNISQKIKRFTKKASVKVRKIGQSLRQVSPNNHERNIASAVKIYFIYFFNFHLLILKNI